MSECLFTCTFTLWVYKHLTWGKCKSLSSARCSAPLEVCWLPALQGELAGCFQGPVQLTQPAVKSDYHHSLLETSAGTAESLKGRKRYFSPCETVQGYKGLVLFAWFGYSWHQSWDLFCDFIVISRLAAPICPAHSTQRDA